MRRTPWATQALTTCSSRWASSQVWPSISGRPVPCSAPSTERNSSLKNEWVASGMAMATAGLGLGAALGVAHHRPGAHLALQPALVHEPLERRANGDVVDAELAR